VRCAGSGARLGVMEVEALGSWMVRREVLNREGLRRALQRQSLYGGSLDTVVLELGLGDEAAVAACLTEATGLPEPEAPWLENPDRALASLLDAASARRLGAVAVFRADERLELVTRYGADLDELDAWAGRQDLTAYFSVVPEVRFEALLARIHGTPLPPRFATLLGRIVGRTRARRLGEAQAPGSREVARPLVETGPRPRPPEPEPDLDVTEDEETPPLPPPVPVVSPPPAASGPGRTEDKDLPTLLAEWEAVPADSPRRQELSRRLRPRLAEPALELLLQRWRLSVAGGGKDTLAAIGKLAELRDPRAVPALLEALGDDSAAGKAAHAALVTITRHDFGTARWRWTRWWREWKPRHRIEWLIDALTEKNAELRLQAAQELEELSGRYFGYHFDLGRREREEARRRWSDWWQTTGKVTLG
jgi:hypothetical protein